MNKLTNKITIDPKIRFGKPVIAGTRITVEEVWGMLGGGMDFDEIQKEYGLSKKQVLTAVNYMTGWVKGEEVKEYEVPLGR